MKKQVLIPFLGLLMAALPAHAQFDEIAPAIKPSLKKPAASSSRAQLPTYSAPSTSLAHGFRVGLAKPILDAKIKISALGRSRSDKDNLDATGFSFGYANIPNQGFGFITDLTLIDGDIDGTDVSAARVSGSAAMGINNLMYLKAGLNYSQSEYKDKTVNLKFDPAFGFQMGAGLQFHRNMGLELSYVSMQHDNDTVRVQGIPVDVEMDETGLELGLVGTF